jgi:hypothetical protein
MTILLEQSWAFWVLLVSLFVFAAILAAMWTATGRREPLWGAAIAIGLMPLLWLVERVVVTDRETIEATLLAIAADVKSNNRSAVLSHIHSGAEPLRRQAEAEIANYKFTECKINKLHFIEVDATTKPRSAVAEFNVHVAGTFKLGNETISGDSFFRRIHLDLRQEADGRWRVANYDHSNPFPSPRSAGDDTEMPLPGNR